MAGFITRYKAGLFLALMLFAFAFGMVGFYLRDAAESADGAALFLDMLFNTLTMFFLNYTDPPDNICLNVARFAAAFFTVGALFVLFQEGITNFLDILKGTSPESIYVYGETDEAERFAESAGTKCIRGKGYFMKAGKYVLLGSDEENLQFYDDNRSKLKDKAVFIRSRLFRRVIVNQGQHIFFSPEEIIARKYWQDHHLLPIAFDREGQAIPTLSLAIIGSGELGEELLYQGLQINIFAAKQTITYHLFAGNDGDIAEFERLHTNLARLHIVVHPEPWSANIELLARVDRILLATPGEIELLEKMLCRITHTRIDVFTKYGVLADIVNDHRFGRLNTPVYLFDIQDGIWCPESIFAEMSRDRAMELHYTWSGSPAGETKETLWKTLSAEKRYANLAAVDYHFIQKCLVRQWLGTEDSDTDWLSYAETLAELEHIRWCHYYWFNNWRYPEEGEQIADGKTQEEIRRLHLDLRPYAELPEADKEKDREQIRKLFGMDG